MLSPLIREIVFDLPAGEMMKFRAGAFVQVTAPAYELRFADFEIAPKHHEAWERFGLSSMVSRNAVPTVRAYSIANRPQDQ